MELKDKNGVILKPGDTVLFADVYADISGKTYTSRNYGLGITEGIVSDHLTPSGRVKINGRHFPQYRYPEQLIKYE